MSGNFAALLRGYRRATGLTQDEFAAKAGVGVRTLRDLERGRARPQRATADLLATALGLRGAAR
ncbi:MAG TPA: helix-turn-helix transcriptional regulator, partial [Rugosimonospora sp.]|nr:helix-turn-helix transcriptional regulator [Rugosimonospora sp.]